MTRLQRWKQSVLDRPDRLLDVGDEGIPIAGDPIRLAFSLLAESALALVPGGEQGGEQGRLRAGVPAGELARRLATIDRAARDALADGEQVLWLALGLLAWTDVAGISHTSPVVLWPVELERSPRGARLLVAPDRAPRVNELLLERLAREHQVTIEVSGELDLAYVLEQVAAAALARPGWHLERASRLGAFSFSRFEIERDLALLSDRHPERLDAAPIAWLTGTEPVARLGMPAGDLLAPLDADASQLAAVGAAGAGASFVVSGAPGTGKTQTIANVIAHCASQGKTLLVVSDRASQLDAIQERLASVGLADTCVPLYGRDDVRGPVLRALARVLDRTVRPFSVPGGAETKLADLRAALDGYVAALHEVGPLGMSPHEVLGKLVELRTTPCAALSEGDAAGLDRATYDKRLRAVEQLADAALAVEPVAMHPWRIATVDAWNPEATDRVSRALDDASTSAAAVAAAITELAALVPGIVAKTPDQLRVLGSLAELAAASPRPGAELLTNMRNGRAEDIDERVALIRARGGGSVEVPRDPTAFLAVARRHRALATEVGEVLTDRAQDLDAPTLLAQLKKWTGSVAALRYMALRAARNEVRAAAIPGQLETDEAMLTALEALIAEQACRTALLAAAEPAKRWFGDLGGDPLTLDLARIEAAVAWATDLRKAFDQLTITGGESARQAAWRALIAQVAATPDATEADLGAFARLAAAVARWEPALVELAAASGIARTALGAGPDHLVALRDQLEQLKGAIAAFEPWVKFQIARRAALVAGVNAAVAAIDRGDLGAAELAAAWQRATLLAWFDAELARLPELGKFSGAFHHMGVSRFIDLDRSAVAMMRARAAAKLAERTPRSLLREAETEVALLRKEADAPLGRPLRAVLAELPALLPRLAPCLLATPDAVAAHLDPALAPFDVVVFDEASRLPVAHALGALARGKSMIIVGDPRQATPADGAEGLLDAALVAGLPELPLGVHYRSRHEDLFAFANHRYYADRVEVLPAAAASPDLGISWRKIDGTADATGANRAEADAIVAELTTRLREAPQRSLAVVALSSAQRRMVEDALDAARATDVDLDVALDRHGVLIGTPDRLQGEHRDVVLLTVGHAADALGMLAQPGADRWLAIATTRAREQLIVMSSFAPDEVAGDAPAGVRALLELIAFARAGGGAARPVEDAPAASPITAAIARALGERGWIVRHRIGSGPFKIDLAVVDPNDGDKYVLAIEHDGAAYASAGAARERDRLRAQMLTALGWRLHRIWALDWWLDPEREIQRAHGAIVAAIAASRNRTKKPEKRIARGTSAPVVVPTVTSVHDEVTVESSPVATAAVPVVDTAPISFTAETAPVTASRESKPNIIARKKKQIALPLEQPVASGSAPVAAEAAADTQQVALASGSGPTETPLPITGASTSPIRLPRGAIAIGPYAPAAVPAGRRAPDDMFAARYFVEVGNLVERVLAAEAPIHIALLARRVAAYFGIGKVTEPVIDRVLAALEGRGKIGDEQGIVWRADQDLASVPPVRVAGATGAGRRDIDQVPLSELAAAARIVVERANGIAQPDLVRDCARLLGFARMTDKVSERVALGIRLAATRELIAIDNGKANLIV